jgi:hypothetical protein
VLAGALLLAAGAQAKPGTDRMPSFPGAYSLAGVRLVDCNRTANAAVFYARMQAVPGSRRMGMRLTLTERAGEGSYERLRVPGLGRWRTSAPGRPAFGLRQRVRNLANGAAYRMRVDYRWYGRDGDVIRSARRRSRACVQRGTLPNLRARMVGTENTSVPGVVRYSVQVVNASGEVVSGVPVRLSVDGAEVNTRVVDLLAAREARTLVFRGPPCERRVVATADPRDAIPESSESDNSHLVLCP